MRNILIGALVASCFVACGGAPEESDKEVRSVETLVTTPLPDPLIGKWCRKGQEADMQIEIFSSGTAKVIKYPIPCFKGGDLFWDSIRACPDGLTVEAGGLCPPEIGNYSGFPTSHAGNAHLGGSGTGCNSNSIVPSPIDDHQGKTMFTDGAHGWQWIPAGSGLCPL